MNLPRPHELDRIRDALRRSRVVALLGPRQCGKATLARELLPPDSTNYFDLEDPSDLRRLADPMTALRPLTGLVVIDEVQRRQELFPILRVLADRADLPAKFLILGSAAPDLLRQSSESLAGRVAMVPVAGLCLADLPSDLAALHWRRGGSPLSLLAASDADAHAWCHDFMRTFLERDVPQFGIRIPADTLLRAWTLLAHYHGQIWNAAEAAGALGVDAKTMGRYLDVLTSLFMIRRLPPWHANLAKRQVKSPKLYFRDTGLLHALLGVCGEKALLTHPRVGASWEGYVIEEILKAVAPEDRYFWATHAGAELDLLMFKDGRRIGVEIKRTDAPALTESMRVALEDLALDALWVVYPGEKAFPLADRVRTVPARMLADRAALAALLADLPEVAVGRVEEAAPSPLTPAEKRRRYRKLRERTI